MSQQYQLPLAHDRKHTALLMVACKPELFREDFAAWLKENFSIWEAFEREANRVWYSGRHHYAANTIIEHLRHETLLADKNAEFKMNDRWTSSIARLYVLMHEDRAELFEFRQRHNGVVQAPHHGRMAACG